MANDRMYLVHKPTGLAVFIGKTMGNGWYLGENHKIEEMIQKLYDVVGFDDYMEGNFTITSECNDSAFPWNCCSKTDDGLLLLENKTTEGDK